MNKKELEKLISEYKPKYLYQRYNGEIRKHEIIDDRFLVDVKKGMSIDFKAHLILGKISNNIIDLVEVDDYVNGHRVLKLEEDNFLLVDDKGYAHLAPINIVNIVTKEQFEERKFYV